MSHQPRTPSILSSALGVVTLAAFVSGSASGSAFAQSAFVRGDANADQSVELTDAIVILRFLFLGGPETLDCQDAADTDDSGELTITDGIYLLGYLFLGGPAPAIPGPQGSGNYPTEICGLDPTEDGLGCATHLPCPEIAGDASYIAQLKAVVTMELPEGYLENLTADLRVRLEETGVTLVDDKATLVSPEMGMRGRWLFAGSRLHMVETDGFVRFDRLPSDLTQLTDVPLYWNLADRNASYRVPVLNLAGPGESPEPTLLSLPYVLPENMDDSDDAEPVDQGGGAADGCPLRTNCNPVELPARPCCLDYDGVLLQGGEAPCQLELDPTIRPRKRDATNTCCVTKASWAFAGSTCFRRTFCENLICFNEQAFAWSQYLSDEKPPSCFSNHKYRMCQALDDDDFQLDVSSELSTILVRNRTPANHTLLSLDPPNGTLELVGGVPSEDSFLEEGASPGDYFLWHYDDDTKKHAEEVVLTYEPESEGECVRVIGKGWGHTKSVEISCPALGDVIASFPSVIQPGVSTPLEVQVTDTDGLPTEGLHVELDATGGTVADTSGTTNAVGTFATTALLGPDSLSITIEITVRSAPEGTILAETTAVAVKESDVGDVFLSTYFPGGIHPEIPEPLKVTVTDSDDLPIEGLQVDFGATGGTVADTSGATNAVGTFTTIAVLDADSPSITIEITARSGPGGTILAEASVAAIAALVSIRIDRIAVPTAPDVVQTDPADLPVAKTFAGACLGLPPCVVGCPSLTAQLSVDHAAHDGTVTIETGSSVEPGTSLCTSGTELIFGVRAPAGGGFNYRLEAMTIGEGHTMLFRGSCGIFRPPCRAGELLEEAFIGNVDTTGFLRAGQYSLTTRSRDRRDEFASTIVTLTLTPVPP